MTDATSQIPILTVADLIQLRQEIERQEAALRELPAKLAENRRKFDAGLLFASPEQRAMVVDSGPARPAPLVPAPSRATDGSNSSATKEAVISSQSAFQLTSDAKGVREGSSNWYVLCALQDGRPRNAADIRSYLDKHFQCDAPKNLLDEKSSAIFNALKTLQDQGHVVKDQVNKTYVALVKK